ncbi:hypothetical protein [Streptomyces hydrogenans]|uniref:hypothetical protein n=1 Tax=Streptomyces hydrogenans TaxID=1873719 RepID=UPI0033EBD14D
MSGVSSFRSTLAGLLSAYTALAVAGLVRPAAGPVTVVGGAVIDRTPAPVKDFAIRTFGENDKTALQLGILALLGLIACALGILALSRPRAGAAGVLLFGVVGAVAALSRPDSTGIGDVLPSVVGALAGALVLYLLAAKAVRVPAPAGVTAVAAISAGALGRYFTGRQGRGAAASRESLVLPEPASPVPTVPAGVQLKVPAITAFTTPNADFCRVDTWRQWSYRWNATPGGHNITVRATDGTGQIQTEQRTRTIPDGASGRHSVFVTVT